jgi:L-iditol 2-dehydrogenase
MGTTSMTIPLLTAATREVDLLGVFRYANTYPEAIGLMSNCPQMKYKLEKLITHQCVLHAMQSSEQPLTLLYCSADLN